MRAPENIGPKTIAAPGREDPVYERHGIIYTYKIILSLLQ